jgi:hypothetical protein
LSIFGDKRPRNGSKYGEMAPRTGTGCPHIGPFGACCPNQASHPERPLLFRNVQRFRGGLVFKAHRLLYHSVESNQKEEEEVLFFFFFFFVVTLKRKI